VLLDVLGGDERVERDAVGGVVLGHDVPTWSWASNALTRSNFSPAAFTWSAAAVCSAARGRAGPARSALLLGGELLLERGDALVGGRPGFSPGHDPAEQVLDRVLLGAVAESQRLEQRERVLVSEPRQLGDGPLELLVLLLVLERGRFLAGPAAA